MKKESVIHYAVVGAQKLGMDKITINLLWRAIDYCLCAIDPEDIEVMALKALCECNTISRRSTRKIRKICITRNNI